MTSDTGPSGPLSEQDRVATLVIRLDDRDQAGMLLDLSDMISAAWPNGISMDQ